MQAEARLERCSWLFAAAVLILGSSALAAHQQRPPPALGAFTAPVHFEVTVNGAQYVFDANAITFAPSGTEVRRSLSGVGTLTLVSPAPPPPPPPAPLQVTGVTPNPVASGGTITVTGTGFAAGAVLAWRGAPLATSFGSATRLTATLPLLFGAQTLPLSVTVAGQTVIGPLLTVDPQLGPPPPPPGKVVDVHTLGVKGDGVTLDRTALNAAIQNAAPGTTLYFPAGTYLVDDALKVYRNDIGFLGVGDTSIIKSVAGSYHFQVGHGAQQYTGISFAKLQFYGTPGAYMADGTARGGCLLFGCKGVSFTDCLFKGCAEPIVTAGPMGMTWGTAATRCRFNGWGRMCIFCSGGERIADCQLIQDDPNLFGERSSHGFYIHSGSSDVEVKDTEISGAKKYAIQLYGENDPNPIRDIRLLRLNIHDCANGIIFAHGAATAGMVQGALIQGCTIKGVYAGSSLAIKNGTGVQILGNVIDGNSGTVNGHTGAGCYLGVFAPYEMNYSLTDILVQGNVIKNCDRGIWTLPSNGGTFTNLQINGNQVSGCRTNYDITGPGVVWVPGLPAAARVKDSGTDTRPSDDRLTR